MVIWVTAFFWATGHQGESLSIKDFKVPLDFTLEPRVSFQVWFLRNKCRNWGKGLETTRAFGYCHNTQEQDEQAWLPDRSVCWFRCSWLKWQSLYRTSYIACHMVEPRISDTLKLVGGPGFSVETIWEAQLSSTHLEVRAPSENLGKWKVWKSLFWKRTA